MNQDFKTNNFDLLRLFAATEVLLLHSFIHLKIPYPEFFKVMLHFPGVPMFFVMSGFLISASLERNDNLKKYFRNRAYRIYPALWTCIILTIVIIYSVARINFINAEFIPWLFSQLAGVIYTPEFLKGYGIGSYNGSLWTIPLEIQFYLVLPVLYFLLAKITVSEKLKTKLILIVFVAFFVVTYFIRSTPGYDVHGIESTFQKIIRYTFIPNVYLFILGIFLQRIKLFKSKYVFGKGFYWLGAYIVYAYLVPDNTFSLMAKFCLLGITTIALAYTFPKVSHRLLKGNDISYGIYIYHGLILGALVYYQQFGNHYYIYLIIVLTVLLASLSWILIEKPMLKRKKISIKKQEPLEAFELKLNH